MDLYAILGLARDADLADIRRAYRRLARRCHPGINPGDRDARARFEQITAAFETLSDADRRRAYDHGRAARDPAGRCVDRIRRLRLLGGGHGRAPGVDVRRPVRRRAEPRGGARQRAGARAGDGAAFDGVDHVRRRDGRRRPLRADHAPGAVPDVRRRRRRGARADAVPRLPGPRPDQDGARPHGLREAVRRVSGKRRAAGGDVPIVPG